MDIILKELNDEQRQAAKSKSKYLKITAGPGTGKTSTLAARILNLQYEDGLSRQEVLAISFSRSAKQQLLRKMDEFTGKMGYGSVIEILTFHSLAHRIIRYGVHNGESKFKRGFQTINTLDFIKKDPSIIEGLCNDYSNRDLVGTAITQALNLIRQGHPWEESICRTWTDIDSKTIYKIEVDAMERVNITGSDLINFWRKIDHLEKQRNITDFQGLIHESINLLNRRSYTYMTIANELRHILVDEYQDTSLSQEELLFSLAGDSRAITVVGDKNQTIYTFNGSNERNLDRFVNRCDQISAETTEHIKLKKNYRSTPEIINLSNHFIGNDIIEPTKSNSPIVPVLVNTHSTSLAAAYVAKEIQNLCRMQGHSYDDICILFRKNSENSPQANAVIAELENYNIPYRDSYINVDEKVELETSVQELSDNFPGVTLEELLKMFSEKKDINHDLVEFIRKGIEQGATDAEDLLDLLVEPFESTDDSKGNKVTIQSVHAAKGQEYPIVFILYLGDRQFPHGRRPNINEEKRLLYVGITRAMKQLYILGQHGIHHEDFLGQCKSSLTIYKNYSSKKEEEIGQGFSEADVELIRETNKGLQKQDDIGKKRLEDIMAEW